MVAKKNPSLWETYKNMLLAAGSYKGEMQLAMHLSFLGSITSGLAFSGIYFLVRNLDKDDYETALKVGWGMMGLIFLEAIIRLRALECEYTTQMDAADEARVKLGEKLREVPLEYLHQRQTGDLNVVLSGDVNDVVMIMGSLYNIVVQTLMQPVTTIIVTYTIIDWRIALAMTMFFPIAIPLYQQMRQMTAKEEKIGKEAHALVTNNLIEYTQGLEVLRATCQVGSKSMRLQASLKDLREKQTVANRLGTIPNILMSTIVQFGIFVVTMLAVWFCWKGTLEVHVFLATIAITVRFAEPLSIFAALAGMFDFMENGLLRIRALLKVQPLPTLSSEKILNKDSGLDIAFENVSFSYAAELEETEGEQVLSNVSLQVPARSLTALVGESGGGKTTITKLLTRYADPQGGSIQIGDGVDIRSLQHSELMQCISVVFQDVYLFDDTIRANIRMAKTNASDAEVEMAAEAANCHEFISRLPEGYDTKVGEIGGALSGGERQRISIARAILKDAPIVVLDEPTSALDTESEVAVQRAIDRLVESKTVVVIAHRLSTVVAANQILVLQEGKITERGTHDELLQNGCGKYAAMWAAQNQERRWGKFSF